MKEYSLECEDVTPSARDIFGKNNVCDYLSPKKISLNSPKKGISPLKKSLFCSPSCFKPGHENDSMLQFHFLTENFEEKKNSILGLLEMKKLDSFEKEQNEEEEAKSIQII
jgi:hypothetical protein